MKLKRVIIRILFLLMACQTNAQDKIERFDDLKNLILSNSLTLKSGALKLTQAKKEKLAAVFGLIEPTGNITGSYTNNTQLPVNLIPAEILGGEPGTFKEVKFGVQYVTNLNAYAEIKLINFQNWENLRLSRINIKVTESEGKITLKNLLENAAVIYYNILNLQEQAKILRQNLLSADTLYNYTLSRYSNGLASIQDLNDTRISRINIEESIRQIEYHISQQYIALKILCDFPDNSKIVINQQGLAESPESAPDVVTNPLLLENAQDRERLAMSNFKLTRYSYAPSLSLFAAYQEQQFNTSSKWFDNEKNWLASNYIGIRVSVPLPSSVGFRQTTRARYDYLIARNYATQMNSQPELYSKQLVIDYEMAKSQMQSAREVFNLRKENYRKNWVNYQEGIVSIEYTIMSFNDLINSQINYQSSIVKLLLAEEKININNKIK